MRVRLLCLVSLITLSVAACGAVQVPRIVASHAPLHITSHVSGTVTGLKSMLSRVVSISMVSPSAGFALAQDSADIRSALLFTQDGGRTWKTRSALPDASVAIQFLDARDGYAATPRGLLATTDGGLTWQVRTQQQFSQVKFATTSDGIALSQSGSLLRTADGGRTWQPVSLGQGLNFRAVSVLPGPRYYAVASGQSGAALFASANGGANWTELFSSLQSPGLHGAYLSYLAQFRAQMGSAGPSPTFTQGASVTFTTPSVGWVSLFDGGLLATLVARTTDGGQTFTYGWGNVGCAMGCNAMGGGLYPAAYLGAQDAWRYNGQAVDRSTDGGQTFQAGGPVPLGLPASNALQTVQFVTPDFGIAGGQDGIVRTTDAGRTWQRVWPAGPGPLEKIAMTASGLGVAQSQAQPSVLWLTRDGGKYWRKLRTFPAASGPYAYAQITDFWAFPGGRVLVADGQQLFSTRDYGRTWQARALAQPASSPYGGGAVTFSSLSDGWYINVGDSATASSLYATTNGGRTWQLHSSGPLKVGPTNCQPTGSETGWCLSGVKSPTLPPTQWVLDLMATTDGGRHFTTVGTVSMAAVDGDGLSFYSPYGGVVAETKALLLTQSAGQRFKEVTLAHPKSMFFTQVDAVSAQQIYLLTGSGTLLVTSDGGRNWRQVP